jgi:hypothetical protein
VSDQLLYDHEDELNVLDAVTSKVPLSISGLLETQMRTHSNLSVEEPSDNSSCSLQKEQPVAIYVLADAFYPPMEQPVAVHVEGPVATPALGDACYPPIEPAAVSIQTQILEDREDYSIIKPGNKQNVQCTKL